MDDGLKELVKSYILERSNLNKDWPLVCADTNPLFIPIKNNQVSLSEEIESLEDADSCMLFFTYYKDKLGDRWPYINPYREFKYIDLKRISYWYYDDDGFEIGGLSGNSLLLKYDATELMKVSVTEDNIKNLWNCYQIAKKCLKIQREELESAKSELEKNIETHSNDYESLKQRYENLLVELNL